MQHDTNCAVSLNIVQFNICGLASKKDELKSFFMTIKSILPCCKKHSMHKKQTPTSKDTPSTYVIGKTAVCYFKNQKVLFPT